MTEKENRTITPTLLHSTNAALLNWRSVWIVLVVGLIVTTLASF